MSTNSNKKFYPITGTRMVYIPRDADGNKAIRPGKDYFYIKMHSAQAAFNGHIWEKVKSLIVASKVDLNHQTMGEGSLQAIQRSREVARGRAEQLGLSPNLIDLVPAVMPSISISIDFILDKQNHLVSLAGLINDDSFLAVVSLAPGAALVATTVSKLAGKIIQTFIPASERAPILQFGGAFNLTANDLQDGYYVILGTRDANNPIPSPMPEFNIKAGELLADGQPITQLSYVVFDVRRAPARTRDLNDGAVWDSKLREAENAASNVASDPFSTDEDRQSVWNKCKNLIRDAQALLRDDPNYLRTEANNIIKDSYNTCAENLKIWQEKQTGIIKASRGLWQSDQQADLAFMGIDPNEDLKLTLDHYHGKVGKARQILQDII